MSEPQHEQDTRLWMRYAQEDLETARELVSRILTPRHVCFLAQQAAEKAIKAALIFCQIDFPRSHDLEALINLVPQGWAVKNLAFALSALTEWAVEARYPGDWPEATHADAQVAIDVASEVVREVAHDLKVRGLSL